MLIVNIAVPDQKAVVIIALDKTGRALMTRDMELIRKIFARIRSRDTLDLQPIDIPDADAAILAWHIELLHDAHLIEAQESNPLHSPHPYFIVKDLTWDGHDFAAALENDTVWNTIMQKLSPKELAGLPLSVVKKLAIALLEQSGGPPAVKPLGVGRRGRSGHSRRATYTTLIGKRM